MTLMNNSAVVALAAWEAAWARRLILKCCSKCLEARWEVVALEAAVWAVVVVEEAVEASLVGSTLDEKMCDWKQRFAIWIFGLRFLGLSDADSGVQVNVMSSATTTLFICFSMTERAKGPRLFPEAFCILWKLELVCSLFFAKVLQNTE